MWVFPGGRIDRHDYPPSGNLELAARAAAARETHEEAGLEVRAQDFEWFAHWTPAPGPRKRFATWFFAAQAAADDSIRIDDSEIKEHAWLKPAEALAKHGAGKIDLVPPSWVTLYHLSRYATVAAVLDHFRANDAKVYSTRLVKAADGKQVALWHGDAGYEEGDASQPGPRHRLSMVAGGWRYERS